GSVERGRPSHLEGVGDAVEELERREGLGQVEVGARRHAGFDVGHERFGGQQDDAGSRKAGIAPDRLEDLEAVATRHLDVQQDKLGLVLLYERPGLVAVGRLGDLVFVRLDRGVDEQTHAGLVVGDEHGRLGVDRDHRLSPQLPLTFETSASAIRFTAACDAPASLGRTAVTPTFSRAETSTGASAFTVRTSTGTAGAPSAPSLVTNSSPWSPGSIRSATTARGFMPCLSRRSAVSASAVRTVV